MAEQRIRRWLATGLPGHQTLTGAIRDWIMMQQNGFCCICGLAPEWNGATLVFVLDHIDGDGSNHVRENRGKGRHYRRERYRAGLSS